MKTILYNPIFINPQAYYVFPRLTRYLQPDNESTSEPANYIGTIEVKVIAYGDTTLKRTYTNTDSIDLSEFKNTWIRISLFTKVGSCVLGEWKIGNMESDLPYIDPEVLASLKAVVIVGNKTNNDSDRAIVKNLVDPDNPFVISNAAYTEGSGYADKGSPYYGAFVTDGIDDLIKSTKSATEMLDGSNEVTVVSMIHQIKTNSDVTRNNWFFTPVSYLENRVVENKTGKTGIYGYTSTNVTNAQISDITPILGDKNDYTLYSKIEDGDRDYFTVEGFQNQGIWYVSSIAWYWTIIANKVLTTDQINQVIAYFNLDRTLKPDILCDVKKQGITNDNHAEFGDKLIDFSGNGRDIQLNNIAWKGDSGIGKYETDFTTWTRGHFTDEVNFTPSKIEVTGILTTNSILINNKPTPIYNVETHSPNKSIVVYYQYNDDTGVKRIALVDGINELPSANDSLFVTSDRLNSKGITITQIPSHAGALCLDGVNDFGKVTGMPVYKDYTVVADREIIDGLAENADGGVALKGSRCLTGAFCFDYKDAAFSFGTPKLIPLDTKRFISYQSKYVSNGIRINIGTATDNDELWIGRLGNDERYSKIAIRFLMSFPYSMSEFLIERQLKKHKLGTLYPDMVEFRPIVKSNSEYQVVDCYIDLLPAVVGNYYPINSKLRIAVTTKGAADEVTSLTVNGVSLGTPSVNGNRFTFNGTLSDKSPQKINITIDEYIRFEDIVQPYPVLLRFKDENGNEVSWGGKFRVGSTIARIGSAADSNLLPNIYNIFGLLLNGNQVTSFKAIVEKTMVFKAKSAYIFDNNEPNCILSPRLLRIPNSSYKILGYIPDISGHGNNGKINNSAYAEGSGVNEDGSYQFDGVDDFVTIPTTVGGKQVLMKVNWQSDAAKAILYDQRGYNNEFAIYNGTTDSDGNPIPAYQGRNDGQTYIDGILNSNIKASELKAITHNITITNELSLGTNNTYPVIGTNKTINGYYANMALYDFMLFDDISTDDKIKELNEYVGIEGNTE